MAVLQKIRNRAGLLVGALGLALLAFILSDLFSSSDSFMRKFKDKAFTVDGDVVSTGAYQNRIDQYDAFHEFLFGNKNQSGENTAVESLEKVYREMVEEMILDKEAEKLGLTVTSEEMSELVYSANISPIFMYDQEISRMFVNPQTGQFDQSILTNFLSFIRKDAAVGALPEQQYQLQRAREAWEYVNNKIKYQRLREKYSTLIGSTLLASEEEAKAALNDMKYNSDLAYVVQPYTAIPDSSVRVSDNELKDLYNKRKNNFKLNSELRTISYYVKDVMPSDEDYASVERDMVTATEKLKEAANPASIVNEYSSSPYFDVYIASTSLPTDVKNFVQSSTVGDVYGPVRDEQSYIAYKYVDQTMAPDSIYIQQMPMPGGLDQVVVDVIADSLVNVIKKGKDFEVVAKEIWPDFQGGTDWVTEIQLSQINISSQCFAAAKGDILKLPINGQTWLIRIADKKAPVSKVKIATIVMPVIVSDKTQNSIDNELNQFITEYGNVENFDKGAESKGYNLMSNTTISPSNMGLENVTVNTRSIVRWAFNNKIGEVNKFDLSDKKIVAIISGKIDGEYTPLSDPTLNKILKDELIRDKKAEKMISDFKSKNLTSLDAYAQTIEGKIDTVKFVSFQTRGVEPLINAYSKVGQVNKLEAPLKGESGVYALYIADKKENTEEPGSQQIKMQLNQESTYLLRQSALYVLRIKMDVEDNRVKFW